MLPARGVSDHRSVFHFHGPWFSESRVQGQSLARVMAKLVVEWRAYRRFAAFTVHSEAFRQVLLTKFRIPEEKVALIYPGVDTTFFTPQNRAVAREALDLPADAFIVGSLRRLVPRMGLDVLLRAAADHPNVFVAIAGDGPERSRLSDLARELGMSHRVRLLGRLDQDMLPHFYSALDCSIIPSRALEGFGLVALEALSCGTPVIASDVGGLPEALGALANEWVFPVGDIARLSELIGRVQEQPPSGAVLRRYAESRSWRQCALEMEAWFATVGD
ncbi:glycosyltransferase family 4 protein [Micromonospora sp. URMC 105]